MEWYLKVVRDNYANFEGRARRKEFWMFTLIHVLISIVIGVIQWMIGIDFILTAIYGLAVLVPGLAVAARRFQDIGKPKTWAGLIVAMIIINFIPFVGWLIAFIIAIVLIFFFVQEGDQGPNEYGPDPKAAVINQPV